MIERFPQQPKKMSAEDRANLAVVGHRIETWNVARTGPGSMQERREVLDRELQKQIDTILHSKYDVSPVELAELEEDLERLRQFDGDELAFTELCAAQEQYYMQVREQYIKNQIELKNGGESQ